MLHHVLRTLVHHATSECSSKASTAFVSIGILLQQLLHSVTVSEVDVFLETKIVALHQMINTLVSLLATEPDQGWPLATFLSHTGVFQLMLGDKPCERLSNQFSSAPTEFGAGDYRRNANLLSFTFRKNVQHNPHKYIYNLCLRLMVLSVHGPNFYVGYWLTWQIYKTMLFGVLFSTLVTVHIFVAFA